ncbi:MAG: extracellular solute-binding protein [Planctomycetales bacterium]|nr:extracellular solute-binding protein [Planctomycetales bacterium]
MPKQDSGRSRITLFCLLAGVMLCAGGCKKNEVVVYTALDREFAEVTFAEFTEVTGIAVRPKFDTEANKTVGLTNLILAERNRPRCDVFWNNEILNTLRLKSEGVLQSCSPATAKYYPKQYRDPDREWFGFAARARVILVNKDIVKPDELPRSISDLTDPKWKQKVGIAKPLFGTTASHAACLFATLGSEEATAFLRQISKNAKVYPGNKQVALAVSKGEIAFGLTDTDDAMVEIAAARPVEIVYPDQADSQLGTLFIPNSLSLIKGARNSENGQRLIEFLLRPETEQLLAAGESAQIPLNTTGTATSRVATPHTIRAMSVDFNLAADKWETAAETVRDVFTIAN